MSKNSNKNRGNFQFLLAMDCETSGICFGGDDPSGNDKEEYQSVSWGLIVVDKELNEVDRKYIEIKWNGDSQWNAGAEKVHGLSLEHLEEHGLDEEEAVVELVEFIDKWFGVETSICPIGHNVGFDVAFLNRLTRRHGISLKFANRMVDSFSVGFIGLGIMNSDELFEAVGCPKRDDHNALVDIEYTLQSLRVLKAAFNKGLDLA